MFDWCKTFKKKKDINKKTRRIAGTLMNIFKQLVLHKTRKRECKHPEWMNLFIIFSLKKTVKYTRRYNKKIPQIIIKIYVIIEETNVRSLLCKQKKRK